MKNLVAGILIVALILSGWIAWYGGFMPLPSEPITPTTNGYDTIELSFAEPFTYSAVPSYAEFEQFAAVEAVELAEGEAELLQAQVVAAEAALALAQSAQLDAEYALFEVQTDLTNALDLIAELNDTVGQIANERDALIQEVARLQEIIDNQGATEEVINITAVFEYELQEDNMQKR